MGDPVASLAMSWKTALPLVSPRPALLWPQQHPPGIPCIETSIVEEEQDMPGAEEPCRDEDAGSPSREGGIGTALTAKMLRANSPGAPLESLEALDLSLEGLGSLAGLPELCPRLTRLSAAANRFRGNALADLVGCFDLQEVLLRENSITGVRGASSLPSLRCLHVDANKISSAEGLEGCSQLQDLSLADNQLVDISATNLAACSRLERLCLSGNRLRVLRSSTLAPLAALQHLDVTGNRLVGLAGLEACPHLLTLKIGSNQLRALPAMGCCQLLRELHAPENHLTVLPKLAWMPHLTVLDVHVSSIPRLETRRPPFGVLFGA